MLETRVSRRSTCCTVLACWRMDGTYDGGVLSMMAMVVTLEVEVEVVEVAELTEAAEVVTLVSMLAEESRQCEQDHRKCCKLTNSIS